jgi:hypothetical protein
LALLSRSLLPSVFVYNGHLTSPQLDLDRKTGVVGLSSAQRLHLALLLLEPPPDYTTPHHTTPRRPPCLFYTVLTSPSSPSIVHLWCRSTLLRLFHGLQAVAQAAVASRFVALSLSPRQTGATPTPPVKVAGLAKPSHSRQRVRAAGRQRQHPEAFRRLAFHSLRRRPSNLRPTT